MKTAISVPDALFRTGERVAKKLSMSRSQLYATALAEFVRTRVSADVTRRLDEVYARESSALDPVLDDLQRQALDSEDW